MALNLPVEWRMQVFISPEMEHEVMQTQRIRRFIDSGRLFLTPTLKPSMNLSAYNFLLWSEEFWNQIEGRLTERIEEGRNQRLR